MHRIVSNICRQHYIQTVLDKMPDRPHVLRPEELLHRSDQMARGKQRKLVANMLDSRAVETELGVEFITNGLRSTLRSDSLPTRDIQAATHIVEEVMSTRSKTQKNLRCRGGSMNVGCVSRARGWSYARPSKPSCVCTQHGTG